MLVFLNKFRKVRERFYQRLGLIGIPFLVCTKPENHPLVFGFDKGRLRHSMLPDYGGIVPLRPNFVDENALPFDLVIDVKLRANVLGGGVSGREMPP